MGVAGKCKEWKSGREFVEAVVHSEAWEIALSDLEVRLEQNLPDFRSQCLKTADARIRLCPKGELILEYWRLYHHDLYKAMDEVWYELDVTSASLKMAVIGILMHQWTMEHLSRKNDESGNAYVRTQNKPTTIEQLDAAFVSAINAMVQNGDILFKQDFGAIMKIIKEKCIYGKFTIDNMLERLDKCNIPGNLKPSKSSLKVLSFGTTPHPNWKITGVDPDEIKRLCTLAEDFIDIFDTFNERICIWLCIRLMHL